MVTRSNPHVVSVSIGSSSRDTSQEITLLGRTVTVERIGTDGDMQAAARLIRELDGKVDAIGLGGIDIYLQALGRRYYLRDAVRLAANARVTPVAQSGQFIRGLGKSSVHTCVRLIFRPHIGSCGTSRPKCGQVIRSGCHLKWKEVDSRNPHIVS